MKAPAAQLVDRDRGLGTAYERFHFYRLLDRWADEYGAASALEGPLDGMAGIGGVHLVGLARRGLRATSAHRSAQSADLARLVYGATCEGQGTASPSRPAVDVCVLGDPLRAADELAPCDLVVAYHALPLADDWRAYLRAVARLAKKVLIVTVCNPDNWGVLAIRLAGSVRGLGGMAAPATWHTAVLAPALWEIGRVREHVYFDAPWWPDLQVAPGQSLAHRAGQLFGQRRGDVRFTAETRGAALAERFVYGPENWPYFGGGAWKAELEPALARHPSFEGARPAVARRVAHLHAFVVDMRPRTPQAKRRLALARSDDAVNHSRR
jgi:hypothetical protein